MSLFGRLMGRRRTRWDENWQTFSGVLGSDRAQWTVDLGAVDAAPVSALPVRLDIEVTYPAGTDGMPTDVVAMGRVEDAVRVAVAGYGGEYIGGLVGGGRHRLTAHLPAEPAGQPSIAGLPEAVVTTAYDPHWAYVRDTLAPDARQHQMLVDLTLVTALSEQGDSLVTPRDIVHGAVFAEPAAAEAAAAELRADGFAVEVAPDDEGEFALTAQRRDNVAPPRIHEITWGITETVERHGGRYDGWQCAVARAS
jgi:hypothetical protein